MKQPILYRLSTVLLTTVLLLCACVMVGQQRDIQRLRAQRNRAVDATAVYKQRYGQSQRELAHQKQINIRLEQSLVDAALERVNTAAHNKQPQFTVRQSSHVISEIEYE